jgi:hypothetical protein
MVQLMNYSLTLSSLFTPAHTHTPRIVFWSTATMYCYVLLKTPGILQTRTKRNVSSKTKITTSSIAKDFHRKSTYNHNHTTAITSQLPLSTGLSGHTGHDPVSIDVGLRSPFERHARRRVTTGCDSLIQSYSHGDAPADIPPV